ncbi:MAG: SURF1 family protein [Gammaproteobacteria bacterium]|nr:SURF1 family protein [Gammaproteobacteria bacterium]
MWQLQRADEKRTLQAEYDRRAVQAPMVVSSTVQPAAALQFSRIEARGFYESDYQLLLDNRIHQGMPGYHVITPLRIDNSDTRVLVNRGWVPLGDDRATLPVIDPPAGPVTVSGIATVPHDGLALGAPPPLTRARPTVWPQFDLARYARSVPFPVQPVVILLDPRSPAGGYVRAWARLDAGIAVHLGYAVQWFALASTVLVVYVVLWLRAKRRKDTE